MAERLGAEEDHRAPDRGSILGACRAQGPARWSSDPGSRHGFRNRRTCHHPWLLEVVGYRGRARRLACRRGGRVRDPLHRGRPSGGPGVLALEMDEMSCETAAENLLRNRVAHGVEIRNTRVEGGSPLPEAPFDGIVANLQSHLIIPLLSSFQRSLVSRGWLILSGILLTQRDEVLSAVTGEGFSLVEEEEEDDWWTGLFRGLPFPG